MSESERLNGTADGVFADAPTTRRAKPGSSNVFDNLAALEVGSFDPDCRGGEDVLTTITVRRPKRGEWIRVHPEYRLQPLICHHDLGDGGEYFLVPPAYHELLEDLSSPDYSPRGVN